MKIVASLASHKPQALSQLKTAIDAYLPLSLSTWQAMQQLCSLTKLDKNQTLYPVGAIPKSFAFVVSGLVRVFITDEKGSEYNKHFFTEAMFPGAMTSLLTQTPSLYCYQAIEQSVVIEIDFKGYRELLLEADDLKLFHIYYLEKNWLLAKDAREVEIVQQDASERYAQFVENNSALAQRLPQYHIASHLGITPTQLSRIRKKLVV